MYILLYSKYSRSCMRLLDIVEQLNGMTPTVQLVCIDNKETRKQILNYKSIEITKVPCLLILNDTTVEKYDGERAFEWVSEVVKKLNVQSQPPPPPPPPPQTVIEIEPPSRPQKEQKRPQKRSAKKETRIEDLDDIEEDDENDSEPQSKVKKPPIPIRNGAGSYLIDGDNTFSETEEDVQEKKSSSSGSKGVGILDLAFAMRQEREKENKDNNK